MKKITPGQLKRLKEHAKAMVGAKNRINNQLNEMIKSAQRIGYSINPKTGEVKEI